MLPPTPFTWMGSWGGGQSIPEAPGCVLRVYREESRKGEAPRSAAEGMPPTDLWFLGDAHFGLAPVYGLASTWPSFPRPPGRGPGGQGASTSPTCSGGTGSGHWGLPVGRKLALLQPRGKAAGRENPPLALGTAGAPGEGMGRVVKKESSRSACPGTAGRKRTVGPGH